MSLTKSVRFRFSCIITFFLASFIQPVAQQVTHNDAWVFSSAYGVPVSIAYNDTTKPPGIIRRSIFVYIEEQNFSAENIRKLFMNLAAEYKTPVWLDITAFSDKKMLLRAINTATSGWIIDWADTPEGRAAAKKWSEEHNPLPSGYYRARYSRIGRQEYSKSYLEEDYSYSPDPAKPEMVRVVLQAKPVISPYSGNPEADLTVAAYKGDTEKVLSLLEKGVNVNTKDKDGNTALILASLSGRDIQTVRVLLANGADVNAKNKKNHTALIYSASNKKADIASALLEKGADINHQDDNGYSALIMAAAVEYRLEPLKVLLSKGANVELKDNDGETALIKAAGVGSIEMVRALLEKGANVTVANEKGDTPLPKAAALGKAEIVKLLLEKGANVNARNEKGETSLMLTRDKDTTNLLLANGAEINARDEKGATALMYAAQWGAMEKAQILIDRGANITAKNKKGETALQIADKGYYNNNAMLDLLEDAEEKLPDRSKDKVESSRGENHITSQPQLLIKRDPNTKCCEEVSSVAFSTDGKMLATKLYHSTFAGNHGTLLWDASNGILIKSIEGPQKGVIPVEFSPDGRRIFTDYGYVRDIESGKTIAENGEKDNSQEEPSSYSQAMSADGRISVIASRKIGERNQIMIRDAKSGELIKSFPIDSEVQDLRLSADSKNLAGVFRNPNRIFIWDAMTGEVKQKIEVASPGFYDLAYSQDGRMFAASMGNLSQKDEAKIFDASTGKVLYSLNAHASVVFSLAFSNDGKLLASGGGDAKIMLWDAATGKLLKTMEGHTGLARMVRFSPDDRLLVSGGGKNETKIWSVNPGELLITLQAFNDGNWIAYTPDGYYNCSEGATKYIKWRVGKQTFDGDKYKSQFFKPEIIAARLRN